MGPGCIESQSWRTFSRFRDKGLTLFQIGITAFRLDEYISVADRALVGTFVLTFPDQNLWVDSGSGNRPKLL
jgi:hypothetical protein